MNLMHILKSNKGINDLMTAFFVIILITASVIAIIVINARNTVEEAKLSKEWDILNNRALIGERIINCLRLLEATDTNEIVQRLPDCIPKNAKGIAIEKRRHMNCIYEFHKYGDLNNCDIMLIFPINLPEKYSHCMGKLYICYQYGTPLSFSGVPKNTGKDVGEKPDKPPEIPKGPELPKMDSRNENKCKILLKNGPIQTTLDLVIIGDGFETNSEFENAAKEFTKYLFSIEPFQSLKTKFNVYAKLSEEPLNCSYDKTVKQFMKCDSAKASLEASKCVQFDRILVLYKSEKYGSSAQAIWSKTAYSFYSPSKEAWKKTALHELLHTFGVLDEYSYEEKFKACVGNENDILKCCEAWNHCNVPPFISTLQTGWNCTTDSECKRWDTLADAKCIKGCTLETWYRSSERSLMYDKESDKISPAAREVIKAAVKYITGD